MKIITFNIRNALADDGANGWRYRRGFVYEYLLGSGADVICLQEVVPAVKAELSSALAEVYECVGEGRLAEPKEYDEINLIAYKKSAFRLIEKERFWLSDTPGIAGSKYPTQEHWPRTCTHVALQSENGVYNVFATHLDNVDEVAREKGLNLIISRAEGKDKTLICGDFNEFPENVNKWVNGRFNDCTRNIAATYTEYGKVSQKIDYIFASKDLKRLSQSYADEQIKDGVYISDHFPVIAEIAADGG